MSLISKMLEDLERQRREQLPRPEGVPMALTPIRPARPVLPRPRPSTLILALVTIGLVGLVGSGVFDRELKQLVMVVKGVKPVTPPVLPRIPVLPETPAPLLEKPVAHEPVAPAPVIVVQPVDATPAAPPPDVVELPETPRPLTLSRTLIRPPAPPPPPAAPSPAPEPEASEPMTLLPREELPVKAAPPLPPERQNIVVESSPGLHDERLAQTAFQQAATLIDHGELGKAKLRLEEVLRLQPQHAQGRRKLAQILVAAGENDKALALLAKGLEQTLDAGLVKMYARMLVDRGKDATALELLRRASRTAAAKDAEMVAFLAAMEQKTDNHWAAIDLYENLLRRHPDQAVWRMGMAISLERAGQTNEALDAYRRALESGQLTSQLRRFVRERLVELSN